MEREIIEEEMASRAAKKPSAPFSEVEKRYMVEWAKDLISQLPPSAAASYLEDMGWNTLEERMLKLTGFAERADRMPHNTHEIMLKVRDLAIAIMKLRDKKNRQKTPVAGKGAYDKTLNFLFGATNTRGTKRKNALRDGEKHAILQTDKGWEPARFMGPGTKVFDRVKELKAQNKPVRGLTTADTSSLLHDIQYALARTPADIRKADKRMVQKLDEQYQSGRDTWWNTRLGKWGIQGKMLLEDWGLAGPTTFTTFGSANEPNADPEERQTLESVQDELIKAGYGLLWPGNRRKRPRIKE